MIGYAAEALRRQEPWPGTVCGKGAAHGRATRGRRWEWGAGAGVWAGWEPPDGGAGPAGGGRVGGAAWGVRGGRKDVVAAGAVNADATCAVLCGQKEMTEAVIAILTEAGVPQEKCIMNF